MNSGDNTGYIDIDSPYGSMRLMFSADSSMLQQLLLPPAVRSRAPEGRRYTVPGELPGPVREIFSAVTAYFASGCGRPIVPQWRWLAMDRLTPREEAVLREAAKIPLGEVRSYRQIAEKTGNPRAGRFVGNTMAKNPFPLLIPCHRVIRSDGGLGGFGGGIALKQALLDAERRAICP